MTVSPDTCSSVMTKSRSFCVLWPFSSAIADSFGLPGRCTTTLRPETCLRVMTKHLSFSRFMAIFMCYFQQFWTLGRYAWTIIPDTSFRDMNKNSTFPCFMAVFMSNCPQFWDSREIGKARKTRYMFERHDQKLVGFAFYDRFHELLPTIWGF